MTERQLMNLWQLTRAAEIDCGCLSTEEVEDLQRTVEAELYKVRLDNFKQLIDRALPDMPNSTPAEQRALDAAFEKFYATDWHISFGEHTVTIHNDAIVYNGIFDTLSEVLDNI